MDSEKKSTNKKMLKKNILLALLLIFIAIIPVIFQKNAKLVGSDDKAKEAITQIDTNYKPWFTSIWKPPSSGMETLLFSLQAAIGSGVVCYYFGYLKGKSRKAESDKK